MSLILQPDLVREHILGFLTIEERFVLRHIKEFRTGVIEKATAKAVLIHYARGGHLNVIKWVWTGYTEFYQNEITKNQSHRALYNGYIRSQSDCIYTAATFGHLHIIQWADKKGWPAMKDEISGGAAKGGHIHILQWAWKNGLDEAQYACSKAASHGHIAALKWLMSKPGTGGDDMIQMIRNKAAKRGYIDIIKLTLKHRSLPLAHILCPTAAHAGHVELLEWLNEKGVLCTGPAVCESAIMGGHLEAVKWAIANGSSSHKICSLAASYGHLDVLRWAVEEKRLDFQPGLLLPCAAQGGHIPVLRWILRHWSGLDKQDVFLMLSGRHYRALEWAVANGHTSGGLVCSITASMGDLSLLKWARGRGFGWDSRAPSSAAKEGHLEVLQWAVDNGCPYDDGVCRSASKGGHIEVLEWASQKGFPYDMYDLFDIAQEQGNDDILGWLAIKALKRSATEVEGAKVAWKKRKTLSGRV